MDDDNPQKIDQEKLQEACEAKDSAWNILHQIGQAKDDTKINRYWKLWEKATDRAVDSMIAADPKLAEANREAEAELSGPNGAASSPAKQEAALEKKIETIFKAHDAISKRCNPSVS